MRMMRVLLISIICVFFTACYGDNENDNIENEVFKSNSIVIVNPTLQSNMVLQQNSEFTITGKGTANEKIRVQCGWENSDTFHTTEVESNGKWSISIQTPSATKTAYSIVVQGKSKLTFESILIGEVWLCAGQSNMYWLLKDSENGEEEVNNATYPKIRLLNMTRTISDTPVDDITAEWKICTPDNARYFSAVGYFFGRKLFHEMDIPIGLIASNWGNTGAEVWTERNRLMAIPELAEEASRLDAKVHSDGSPNKVGSTYNSMIYPLRTIPVAGAIWYQGENNQDKPYLYPLLLKTMVEGWREDWNKEFPFYIAQICPYKREWNYLTNYSNPAVRFMQARASEQIANCGIEVNDDLGDINNIHPTKKQDVGLRLAWLALGKTYGKNGFSSMRCPVYSNCELLGNQIKIHFKHADSGFKTSDSEPPSMFEVAGDDHQFYPAKATISGNTIVLSSPSVAKPIAARMGWSYVRITNLRAANGLPVSVFRTYEWDDETEEQ